MTQPTDIQLKPCPFCASAPVVLYARPWPGVPDETEIVCEDHECPCRPKVVGETLKRAAEAWNTRATVPTVQQDARMKAAAGHTPGPWYADWKGYIFTGGDRAHVVVAEAHGGFGLETQTANACLIAAAPSLKIALQQIANGEGVYGAQAHEYKEIARAALALAEGEMA